MSSLTDDKPNNEVADLSECFASKMITELKKPVVFMYRDKPNQENDSGWVFLSGEETVDYIKDASNLSKQKISAIIALDLALQSHLNSPYGTGWKRNEENEFDQIEE